jgi:hypothetical protein
MLDCHIIVSADTPRAWVTQCLDSVFEARDRAGYPVTVRIVDGVPGHIGKARAAGYALGTEPYVTCVDDDDYMLPDAFAQMIDALRTGAPAICTPELTLQNGQLRPGHPRHHLAVYRRSVLIDHTQWPCCGDVAQLAAIPPAEVIDLPSPQYVHRIYGASKARAMRRANPSELERARG